MEKDKLLHFIVCETIAMVFGILFLFIGLGNYSCPIAFAIALAAGIGKEIRDKKVTGLFDPMDLVFDFLGALAGMVFISLASVA